MQIHLVSGFLGSGKTTAIQTACKIWMNEGQKVAVITNDQGVRLVDTGYFESLSIPCRQVIDGCFCCHYQSLEENIQSVTEEHNPAIIFAESVGSCTDIVATVVKPLQQFHDEIKVTVSAFADVRLLHMLFIENKRLFTDEVSYIYRKQLEEAGAIVVTKIDLIASHETDCVKAYLQQVYPEKELVFVNGNEAESVNAWLFFLKRKSSSDFLSSLQIDYDTYGAGEAMLAWLDAELDLYSSNDTAMQDVVSLIHAVYLNIQQKQLPIGHVKFLVNGSYKISYTTTSQPQISIAFKKSSASTLLINARVQTTPGILNTLVRKAISETQEKTNCKVVVSNVSVFQPGYPAPTYRIAD